jgi:hypothetical protein
MKEMTLSIKRLRILGKCYITYTNVDVMGISPLHRCYTTSLSGDMRVVRTAF